MDTLNPNDNNLQENGVLINDCWNTIGVNSGKTDRCPRLKKVIHCRNCAVYSAAGRHLFDRSPPEGYKDEWTRILGKGKDEQLSGANSAFVFRAGGEWLALPASIIREVIEMGTIHTLPHISNNVLRGVVNIRGKLEICVSIGAVLGIEREESYQVEGYLSPERLVVAVLDKKIITFPVSEVIGVIRFRPEMMKELPVTVSGSKAVYTKGILYYNEMDIGFLKSEPLFRTLTRDLA
jgi:chemotaxis-related protein WspD